MPVDFMHTLLVLVGIPLLVILLLALAVYVPPIVRGESVAPAGARADDEWFGGAQGDAEKALEAGETRYGRRDGWGQWQLVTSRAADKFEIDRAIRAAEETSRFEFSVFVGHADGEPRAYAEGLHAALVAPSYSILVMVDPNARVIEVVTGSVVRRTLTDHEVQLAILEMQSAFSRR